MNPLVPVVLLFLGAAGCLLGLLRGFRYTGLVAAGAVFLSIVAGLVLGLRLPAQVTLSRWGPQALFPSGLRLVADGLSWLLAMGLLVATLAVFLTGISRGGGRRVLSRAASLVVVANALTALFADSLVTLAISWTALDAVTFTTLILFTGREEDAPAHGTASRAVIGLGLNVSATVLVIAAALQAENAGMGGLLTAAALPDRAIAFLVLAAVLRLNVFPFHFGLAPEDQLGPGVDTILRLAPLAVGVELLAFVALHDVSIPFHGWLTAGALIAVLLGAAQWWSTTEARRPVQSPVPSGLPVSSPGRGGRGSTGLRGLAHVVLAHAGLILLAALWGGAAAGVGAVAQGLALLLGGASLFLYNGHTPDQRAWAAAPVLAGATLVGLPLTIGYLGQWVTLLGMVDGGQWFGLAVVLIGQVLLAAGYLRVAFTPGEPLPRGEPLVGVAYLFGLGAPLLFALLAGLAPAAIGDNLGVDMPGLPGMFGPTGFVALGGVLLAALLGVALWYLEASTRAALESLWDTIFAARIDWMYGLAWELYRVLRRALRAVAAILEGEGGVLWTLVLALLVWLAFGQS